jgi:hypothetical protein
VVEDGLKIKKKKKATKQFYEDYPLIKFIIYNINMVNTELVNLPPDQENGVYKKPFYYALIHVAAGFLAFHYTLFGVVFVMYQLLQLYLHKRFFVFEGKIKDGNSARHTAFKLGEFLIGMLIAFVISCSRKRYHLQNI